MDRYAIAVAMSLCDAEHSVACDVRAYPEREYALMLFEYFMHGEGVIEEHVGPFIHHQAIPTVLRTRPC